jgi:hypothetical protein
MERKAPAGFHLLISTASPPTDACQRTRGMTDCVETKTNQKNFAMTLPMFIVCGFARYD